MNTHDFYVVKLWNSMEEFSVPGHVAEDIVPHLIEDYQVAAFRVVDNLEGTILEWENTWSDIRVICHDANGKRTSVAYFIDPEEAFNYYYDRTEAEHPVFYDRNKVEGGWVQRNMD